MSKTLFNQNTFQSKNVTNSDDISDLKVDTFKATNAILTNITNAELQAATTGVATNAAALVNKQDILTASNRLNPNFIDAEDDGDSVIITTTEFGSLTGFDNGSGTIQDQIDSKEDAFNVSAPLVKTTTSTPHILSIDTTNTPALGSNQLVLGGGVYQYLLDNYNAKLTNGSTLQLTIDNTGTGININDEISVILATGASATDFGLITGNILNTELSSKQDTLTDAANAGTNISISGAGVISATDTNTEYTAETNGGLAVNASNEFSIDLTNTNATFEIPQKVRIETNNTPQLLVEPSAANSNDGEIEIRGARNGSTTSGQAKLIFANYDEDLNATNILGRIDGRVSNATSNIGGLVFSSFANGSSRTGQLTLSAAGNFNMGDGDTYQDDYKFKVNGDVNLNGSNYIKPQIKFLTYDKDNINSTNWGNGSIQNTVLANRTVGDSFCSVGAGTVTLTKNGYYRIRVSAQLQVKVYTDRLGFMNYLRIISGGTTTNYDFSEYKNFFGWTYTRNNGDGAHGSVSFEDYIYLTSGAVISVRHKLETGGTITFNNTLSNASLDNYLSLQIERVYDTDPEV
jgi:hypothetical protein